jgi:hypothetical protein
MPLPRKKVKTCQSSDWQAKSTKSSTAKLAVVVLNITTAVLIVVERGVFPLAILLLAAGPQCISAYGNVLAGLGI